MQVHSSIALESPDFWVTGTFMDHVSNKIFVICDQSVYVYAFPSGKLITRLVGIHDMSITRCIYYHPFDYLITADRDGRIKIWNRNNVLIHEFHEHHGAITGMFALEKQYGPCLVSCSLDKSLRMYNLDSLTCL